MNNTNIYTNDIPFYNMAYIIDAVIKLSLSVLFSLIISIERELHSHPGGAATHTLVGLASCLFTMISVKIQDTHSIDTADPARICAQIISGMGFLGSATIYKSNNYIKGINTAANLWLSAAISMSIGAELWELGLITALFTTLVLLFNACYKRARYGKKNKRISQNSPLSAPYNDGNDSDIELGLFNKQD